MSREALVVGINRYPLLKENVASKARHLQTAAEDAEAIAYLLEKHGNFNVRRLPATNTEGQWRVNPHPKPWQMLKGTDLEEAIVTFFNPPGTTVPDTALLFFAGHGLRKVQGAVSEGFLATSDACPTANQWGVSLRWLRQVLQSSPVRQQIIWLDCCYSGELLNFAEADPGHWRKRDRCFIAASREFEQAYEQIGDRHGVLTSMLVRALDPKHQRDGWVSNYELVDFINQQLTASPQRPLFHNSGSEIILTGKKERVDRAVLMAGVCPYKGLSAFEFNAEDPQYFYGRTALTDQLLEKVRESNFLAVVGASGSGKSSVVKAGLLHQLRLGRRLSGSDRWQIEIFRPGENPIRNLAKVFVEADLLPSQESENPLESKYYQQQNKAEALLNTGAVGLAELVKAKAKDSRLVLVVDQFEEAFTLCENESLRQQFFECLLGALPLVETQLCLIITMRADFFGKCAEQEYAGLADLIQEHLVTVTPMTEAELQQAITQPAYKVGLEIERELVEQMIADVEGPASLPLLQYTLTELWGSRTVNRLTLAQYTKLGGVKGTLQQRAESVYQSLTPQEQQVAKRIFLDLIQLGEGTEDTRRQAFKVELSDSEAEPLVEQVLKDLADARLVVTSQVRARGENEQTLTVVDIAHESLIRHWSRLRQWVNENRVALRQKRAIEAGAEQWLARSESKDYLLQGLRLAEAEKYLQDYAAVVPLSGLGRSFVEKSIRYRRRNRFVRTGAVASFVAVIAIGAIVSNVFRLRAEREATIATLRQKAAEAQNLVDSEPVDAQVLAIEATGESLNSLGLVLPQVKSSLLSSIQVPKAFNVLMGHQRSITSVTISSDRQKIITSSNDGSFRLWDREGNFLNEFSLGENHEVTTLAHSSSIGIIAGTIDGAIGWEGKMSQGHKDAITSIVVSPDEDYFVSSSADGTIRLWDKHGDQIGQPLRGHGDQIGQPLRGQDSVLSIAISPDGEYFVSGSADGIIRLWDKQGNSISEPIKAHNGEVSSVAVSPNGKYFASASSGDSNTIRLWNREGEPIGQPFQSEQPLQSKSHNAHSIAITPDGEGKTIFSGGHVCTIRVWKKNGELVSSPLIGHKDIVTSLTFFADDVPPEEMQFISGSDDGTVRLWKLSEIRKGLYYQENYENRDRHNYSVAITPDGEQVVSGRNDGTIRFWDRDGVPTSQPLQGHRGVILSVAVSPDGEYIVSGSMDKTVRLWDKEGNPIGQLLSGHERPIMSIAISPNSDYFASASYDQIRLWNRQGNSIKQIFTDKRGFASVAISPDGKYIVSGVGNEIHIWDKEGNPIGSPLKGHVTTVLSIAISPNGEYIVSGDMSGNIRLWDRLGKPISAPLKGHQASIFSISISPDGEHIVSGGRDGIVHLWNKDGIRLGTLFQGKKRLMTSVAFSPDGKYIVNSHGHSIQVWRGISEQSWLNQACNELINHTILTNPKTERAIAAGNTCLHYAGWNNEQKALFFKNQGNAKAAEAKVDEATFKFLQAVKLDPSLDFNPRAEAEIKSIVALLREGEKLIKEGKIEEALSNYEDVQKIAPEIKLLAKTGNNLCYRGSLQGSAANVMDACEKAAALDPGNGQYNDSRGLARALTGDTAGAIEDFQAYIQWVDKVYPSLPDEETKELHQNYKKQRQDWIEALNKGENPFTEEELEKLLEESKLNSQ